MRFNPIEPFPSPNLAYRSVSPWELKDFQDTGVIVGRGAWFSGDRRTDLAFFGETLEEVAHHGEDWRRYLESSNEFQEAFIQKTKFFDLANHLRKQAKSFPMWSTPMIKLMDQASKAEALGSKFQFFINKKMATILKKLIETKQKMEYTSYVLEFEDVPGGLKYSGKESLSGKSEISFPKRGAKIQHLNKVILMKDSQPLKILTSAEFQRFPIKIPRISVSVLDSLVRTTISYREKYESLEAKVKGLLDRYNR